MISDEQLRAALEEYDEAILSALPESSNCDHYFSKGFRRKMRRVRRRAKHPMVYKTLQRAACILLAILVLFGGVVAFNAEVRAAVVDWIAEQIGYFTHYFYAGEALGPKQGPKYYILDWVPDGYTLIDSLESDKSVVHVYINGTGQILHFDTYYTISSGMYLGGDFEQKTVPLGAHTADIYLAKKEGSNNAIVWSDPESGVLFSIFALSPEEDLLRMAENITEKIFE